jgi:predicted phosphodiesterase
LKITLVVLAALAVAVTGCILTVGMLADAPKLRYASGANDGPGPAYPDAEFAVISDLHIYDPSLGSGGEAFEAAMRSDRKLLLDSIALLGYAIDDILKSNAGFVLVSGDLTKDGEIINHAILAEMLTRLTDAGIKVYVVPGNHDVECPDAVSYSGGTVTPVPTITAEGFAHYYSPFGYGEALYRDDNSLSYVAEPVPGLWLLAVDACRYRENTEGNTLHSGKIDQTTADWIAGVLSDAARQGKAVMVLMHHGVVEHWAGQGKLHPDYIIDDYKHFGRFLASHNVRIAFTGHYHAQDITKGEFGDKYIYDVQTGSLVTAPCPIRYCSVQNNVISVESVTIADKIYPGTGFAEAAGDFVKTTVMLEAIDTLKKYRVSDKDAEIIAGAVGDAFAAHYSGDEDPAERPELDKKRLSLWGRFILFMQQYVLDGLWTDLYPGDNNVSFPLH